jgi:hypothetical protein
MGLGSTRSDGAATVTDTAMQSKRGHAGSISSPPTGKPTTDLDLTSPPRGWSVCERASLVI